MAGLSLLPNLGLGGTLGTTGTVGTTTSTGINTPGSKTQNVVKATAKTTQTINNLVNQIATAKQKAVTASQAELPKLQQAIVVLQSQLRDLTQSEGEETATKKRPKNINNIKDKKHMGNSSSQQVQEGMLGGAVKGGAKGAVTGGILGGLGGAALGALGGGPVGALAGGLAGAGAGAVKGGTLGSVVGAVTDEDDEGKKKARKKKKKIVAKEGVAKTLGKVAGTVGGAYGGGTLGAGAGGTLGSLAGGALGGLAGAPLGPAGIAGGAALGSTIGGGAGTLAGALGGGAAGAKLGHDVGDWAGKKIENENEESFEKLTPAQEEVVNALSKRKYWVNKVSYQFAEQEGGPTVFMMKKPNHYTTHYAEVDPEGYVNGESLADFLGGREENEEKLTPKQQRIARLAGDKNKIDAADFAKLRAMKEATEHCKYAEKGCKCNKCKECKANQPKKESVEIPTFLKSILQKNYAQADKYLGSIVNEKIKKLINNAIDKNL